MYSNEHEAVGGSDNGWCGARALELVLSASGLGFMGGRVGRIRDCSHLHDVAPILGLKIKRGRGSVETLVIDHVEQRSENLQLT